jgi:hypothetical protein
MKPHKRTEDNGAAVIKAFQILMIGSHTIDHVGHDMDIDCPDHLAFTLAVPDHFEGHTVVDIAFKPIEDGVTRMVFQQTGVAPEVAAFRSSPLAEPL